MEKKRTFIDNDTRRTKISQSQKARYKRLNQQYVKGQLKENFDSEFNTLEELEEALAEISGRLANQFLSITDLVAERARIKSMIVDSCVDNINDDKDNDITMDDVLLNPNGIKKKITITPEQKDRLFNEQ